MQVNSAEPSTSSQTDLPCGFRSTSGAFRGSAGSPPTTRTTSASVAPFFAGDPGRPRRVGRRDRAHAGARPRAATRSPRSSPAQQERRGAPPRAREAGATARRSATVAIVTGQQAGLFGGPLFTLLKALTALKLAEQVVARAPGAGGRVFWIDAEDHDWDEVRSCTVFDEALAPRTVVAAGAARRRAGARSPPSRSTTPIAAALDELERILPATEFRAALIDRACARAYAPGVGMADAFGRWLEARARRPRAGRLRLVGPGGEAARQPGVRARAVDAGPDGAARGAGRRRI